MRVIATHLTTRASVVVAALLPLLVIDGPVAETPGRRASGSLRRFDWTRGAATELQGSPAAGPSQQTECQAPLLSGYVTDRAEILSRRFVGRLTRKLQSLDSAGGAEMVVVVDRRLPEGVKLEAYTLACANVWGVGDPDENNGVVLFLFTESRKVRLEVGLGLEGVLTSTRSAEIIAQGVQYFSAGALSEGIEAIVDEVIRTVSHRRKAPLNQPGDVGELENWQPNRRSGSRTASGLVRETRSVCDAHPAGLEHDESPQESIAELIENEK